MKNGLNIMEIRKYHKWLAEEVPLRDIARKLHTSVEVLGRLTPEKWAGAEKRKKEIEKAAIAHRAETQAKANVLAETAAKLINEPVPMPNPDIT